MKSKQPPIRRIINGVEDGDVPLPHDWHRFIGSEANKADLIKFLSEYLIDCEYPVGRELVIGGGFESILTTRSNARGILADLACDHEEADTRLIAHGCQAMRSGYKRMIVECSDTDVLLLLIFHFGSEDVWMRAGTRADRKYYNVSQIAGRLPTQVRRNILGFHSFTGCDVTSSFTGFGKTKCWKIFLEHPETLAGIGRELGVEEPSILFVSFTSNSFVSFTD